MSVRVKLRIDGPAGRSLESAAVLNGGFASRGPRLLLPLRAACVLYADYPAGTTPVEGRTAGGRASFREATDAVSVRVVADDRQGPVAACRVLVGEQEDEILASDYAIDALGVEVKRHGEGLWRFAGEDLVRPSVAPEIW